MKSHRREKRLFTEPYVVSLDNGFSFHKPLVCVEQKNKVPPRQQTPLTCELEDAPILSPPMPLKDW